MKTLILNGSPKKKGDTVALINEFKKHLYGDIKVISSHFDNISPCTDRRYCWSNAGCSINDKMQEIYTNIRKAGKLLMAKSKTLGMNVKFQQLDFMRTVTMSILVMTKNIHKEIGTTFAYYHSDSLYKAIKDKGLSGAYGEVPEVKRVGVDPSILNK